MMEVPLRIEKGHYASCLQKNNKQDLKNYTLIFLLPISDKIFERLLHDSMFRFFREDSLISQNQSCFKPGDPAHINFVSNKQIFR